MKKVRLIKNLQDIIDKIRPNECVVHFCDDRHPDHCKTCKIDNIKCYHGRSENECTQVFGYCMCT